MKELVEDNVDCWFNNISTFLKNVYDLQIVEIVPVYSLVKLSQGRHGKMYTHFPHLMFSILKINSDHIIEKNMFCQFFLFHLEFNFKFFERLEIIQISCILAF